MFVVLLNLTEFGRTVIITNKINGKLFQSICMAMHLNRTTEKLCHRSGQVNMKDFLKRSVLHNLFPILSYHFNFKQYNDYIMFISRCWYFSICFNRLIIPFTYSLSGGGQLTK